MMPAVKHFDPIMGVDIHILIIPMVGPVPIPHPHIAMVLDPMDFIPVMGATVMVGVMRRGTAGTAGKTIPHIPMGAPFAKPPMNESEIFMGSAMVLADGAPMSFTALPVLTCQDVGMIAPPRKKPKKTYGMVLPTSIVTAIPAGLPVLVGGPPTIDMMGLAMAGGMKALGGAMGKLRKLQKGSKRIKKVSDAVHRKAKKAMDKLGVPPNAQNKVHKGICSITGHPVDVAAGKLFTDAVDFELPGPLAIKWERTWFSTSVYDGPLGHGWHHNYDIALWADEKTLAVRMADGRAVAFPVLAIGDACYNRAERMTLIRDSRGYAMDTSAGYRYRFYPEKSVSGAHLLQSLTEKTLGSTIKFAYSPQAHLIEITDSVGRFIRFRHNEQGQIKQILLPTPAADSVDEFYCAIEYHYHQGELVAVEDVLKQRTRYRYENHLLVQETLKDGLNFYFKFDGKDHRARCIETWGDGEIYYRKITYDTDNQITKVHNSLGHLTVYHHDGALPHKVVNAKGFVTLTQYNDYAQVICEIDEMGQKTQFEYDDFGCLIKQINPDGNAEQFCYDANQNLVERVNVIGAKWQYQYNNQNRLVKEIDPLERETHYHYNDAAVIAITDKANNRFQLAYDRYGNIRSISDQQGMATQWEFDRLGNVVQITDPKGNQRVFKHDAMGRVIRVVEPDGNVRHLRYDPMDNIIQAKDEQYDLQFKYTGVSRLAERTQAGTTVKFEYDTEEQLTAIVNEQGRVYRFKHDELGSLVAESGFDAVMREYYHDPLGRITRIQRPGGRFTDYQYDALGCVNRIKHNDGFSEEFEYRADGVMLAAKNPFINLSFERNALGLVTRETQNDFWVSSEFDALDNRTRIQSSLGLDQKIQRNGLGDVESIALNDDQYKIDFSRDQVGLELKRSMPGGIQSRWQRDRLGRPCKHEIVQGQKSVSSKTYVWGLNNRLLKVVDALNRDTVFHHDGIGNLVSARYAEGGFDWRMPDAVGNLFKTDTQKDREYGPAGQLLAIHDKKGTTRFEYDPEGNLIRKQEPNGKTWEYRWNGVGLLTRVARPDGEEVVFQYDPLGRRIAKTFKQKTTRWIWDGDNPLHEWVERGPSTASEGKLQTLTSDAAQIQHREAVLQPSLAQGPPEGTLASPITWLFEPGGSSPMAKMVGEQYYSIVADHLGTPSAMFDQSGQAVWSADISIWGSLRNRIGDEAHCPFRWQGQYADVETGLYYNRYRYYDPDLGRYLSQDPIGHAGGNPNFYAYVSDPNIWIDPLGLECWATARKKFWKNEANVNPNKYSGNNLQRMKDGKAPRMTVEVFNPKTGATELKDYSMELHHKNIPQRVGGANVHHPSNLDALTPFEHEAVDPFRNTGRDLISVVKGVDVW